MNIKKVLSAFVTSAMVITTTVFPTVSAYAEESYATAKDFLSSVIDLATTGVESSTLATAKTTVLDKITMDGDVVKYDDSPIGYWYSDSSSTLYTSNEKTDKLIAPTASGYDIEPSTLKTLLTDFNAGLVNTYNPSTSDWSKIVGKYDITLGDVTIPAEQWIEATPSASFNNTEGVVNLSSLTNITLDNHGTDLSGSNSSENLSIMSWLIDSDGNLYLSGQLTMLAKETVPVGWRYYYNSLTDTNYKGPNGFGGTRNSTVPKIKAKLVKGSSTYPSCLMAEFVTTDATNSTFGYSSNQNPWLSDSSATPFKLYNVTDSSIQYTDTVDNAKACGFAYIKTKEQMNALRMGGFREKHLAMFDSRSASKTVTGNTTLSRRLSTLASLSATDVINVTANGWTVNSGNPIEEYLGEQEIGNAGDRADIAAVADVDALSFNVIVPTALPIQVDSSNVVYVASNASITNKSGAAVELTGVEIVPNDSSGWTAVETPSTIPDTYEFNFSTTIEKNTVLAIDEVYPFQYSAKLSPTTTAQDSLELATVFVTVDWAMV